MVSTRSKKTSAPSILAVAYLRMSSDKQDKSLPAQRREIEKWSDENGYKIVRWYEEPGISGDDTHRRIQFRQMMQDVVDSDVQAIVVWDQDRFGRFDSVESGYWIHPLREAGVHLATVTEGVKDWDSYAGRVVYSVLQEGKHQFLQDLAKNVSRGHMSHASKGLWVSGTTPLGYSVAKDKKLELAPRDEVAAVRRIFDLYDSGYTIGGIVTELNLEGRHPRTGSQWVRQTVARALNRPVYAGYYVYPQQCGSKFASAGSDGRPKKQAYQTYSNERDLEQHPVFRKDNHPPIISKEQFWRVQARLRSNRGARTTPHKNGGGFIFSGLLYCGRCGGKLSGTTLGGKIFYDCNRAVRGGKCQRNRVHQTELLDKIGSTLSSWATHPSTQESLESVIATMVSRAQNDTASEAVLNAKKTRLQSKLNKAKTALIEVDRDMREIVQDQIRGINADLAEIEAEIASRKRACEDQGAAQRQVEAALSVAQRLPEALKASKIPEARELLNTLIDRIDVRSEKKGASGRWHISGGTATLYNPIFAEQNLSQLS